MASLDELLSERKPLQENSDSFALEPEVAVLGFLTSGFK